MMQLHTAKKTKTRMKLAIAGPSGSGKTMSALKLAHGMTDWSKICIIDTENGSADLYSDIGGYQVLTLNKPFSPERYIEAITAAEQAGMEVIIIDSMTHEWDGPGGVLDIHGALPGNSFTNWNKLTPRHNAFIQAILQSPAHIISTIRTKQDYVLQDKNGKQVPEKIGLKAITREGVEYEFTLVFDLDIKHNAKSSKDRTNIFMDKPEFVITEETGKQLKQWAESGITSTADTQPKQPPQTTEDKPKATEAQVKHIYVLAGKKGLSNEEIKAKANVESMKDVSRERAGKIIEWLMAKPDTKHEEENTEPQQDDFIKNLENEQ